MKATKKGNKWFLMGMLGVVLVFGLVVVGCGDGNGGGSTFDSALVGVWIRSDDALSGITRIEFTSTGSGKCGEDDDDLDDITATTSGTTLTITTEGYTIEPLTYAIEGATLTISGGTSTFGDFLNGTYTKQ
jgi:hypothetical protein